MPFKDKIKNMLHPHGHKKSASTSSAPPVVAAKPATASTDPNKPPNARDPGFRKSFNLGDSREHSSDSEKDDSFPAPDEVIPPQKKMATLDKYGDDYLTISPRTNATIPDTANMNRGLSAVTMLDEEKATAAGARKDIATGPDTGVIKPNAEKD